MERKITLQGKSFALADITLCWISKHLNGRSISVLLFINMGLKFRKSPNPDFRINWSYIGKGLGIKNPKVAKEIKNLVSKKILIKLGPGEYTWDKVGIEELINKQPDPPLKKEVETITKQEPVVITPIGRTYNELGLLIDEHGKILF